MGISGGMVAHLVGIYGYPSLLAIILIAAMGAPLPVTVLLLAVGALSATRGGPDFWALAVLGTSASVAGDLIDYALGRVGGARLLLWIYRAHRKRLGPTLLETRRLLRRRGSVMVFLSRFLFTTVSSPTSFLVGVSRLPLSRFLAWSILGKGIYVVGNLLLGRLFGSGLAGYESQTVIGVEAAALGLLLPLSLALAARARRRRRASAEGRGTESTPVEVAGPSRPRAAPHPLR
jgi:membrane-associated protein